MEVNGSSDIIHLNVGGTRFTTSRATLTVVPDTFFTSLLSGRISSLKDETGAIFIDRDPVHFRVILNFLRNRSLSGAASGTGNGSWSDPETVRVLLHEAEYYGLSPLVKQLTLCADLETSGCGDVLFYSFLQPPLVPSSQQQQQPSSSHSGSVSISSSIGHTSTTGSGDNSAVVRVRSETCSSTDRGGSPAPPSLHQSAAVSGLFGGCVDPLRVQMVRAHGNSIVVAYPNFVACYKQKDSAGFQLAFTSPHIHPVHLVELVAVNAKIGPASGGTDQHQSVTTMIAVSYASSYVRLMGFTEDGSNRIEVGTFSLGVSIDKLFFIGNQLVALSKKGKIGVWNSMTRHWQSQEFSSSITSYDTAGSLLLLGSSNGVISYIDMQKFPLRMKDNDLLVTELYRDPSARSNGGLADAITAISVFLTPKTTVTGNWIEIAYGTSSGVVRVIVHHPETVGHGPQLFQTFTVHRSRINKVKLSEELLVSVCAEDNHVRTWSVTRFRGMISTQPGSTSIASFKIMSLEETSEPAFAAMSAASTGSSRAASTTQQPQQQPYLSSGVKRNVAQTAADCGPFGEQDDQQVFIQRVIPETDSLYVRSAGDGSRICVIRSVDGTTITSFCVHECEGSSRAGSRSRRFILTGHSSGAVQMWDLSTALDFYAKASKGSSDGAIVPCPINQSNTSGGPSTDDLVKMLHHCDLSNSHAPTPVGCLSPSSSTFLTGGMASGNQQTTRVVINQSDIQ